MDASHRLSCFLFRATCTLLVFLVLLSGCGRLFEDNGTHLAFAIEKEAAKLRASDANEAVVHYETLGGANDPYYVEVTPSFPEGRATSVPGSYLVVSGTTPGGTSYHNRFVLCRNIFTLKRTAAGPPTSCFERTTTG